MQIRNWNDFRYVLALKRGRSLSGAARLLGVDDTTVSRRLSALQSATGSELYRRQSDGTLLLTANGEAVACHAEAMEHRADLIGEVVGSDRNTCSGIVRLTSVPIVVNRWLAPRIGTLLKAHPGLEVELIPDSRDLSLTRREADLALRLARPTTGGSNIKARRIGYLNYAVYAARELSRGEADGLPWITYEDAMAHIPQAHWISRLVKGRNDRLAGIRVHDAETALEAAIAGVGRAVLPSAIAERDGRLHRLETAGRPAPPSRELWLLAHTDQLELRRIAEVIAWIESVPGAALS
ncbi:MAG: LysR family transcriptional regulator [Aestuariivirgaceae bacterium]